MKKILIILAILALAGGSYWYGSRAGLFGDYVPSNLPTRDERQRMEDIVESSSQIDPNAKAGAGVRPVGSLPRATEQVPDDTLDGTVELESDEDAAASLEPQPLP